LLTDEELIAIFDENPPQQFLDRLTEQLGEEMMESLNESYVAIGLDLAVAPSPVVVVKRAAAAQWAAFNAGWAIALALRDRDSL
jgi:hypothetical protein